MSSLLRTTAASVCVAMLAFAAVPARAQNGATIESLARQGFEVKAAFVSVTGNMFLTMQNREAIFVCRLDHPFSPTAQTQAAAPLSLCYPVR